MNNTNTTTISTEDRCPEAEPWGRYSASGGLYTFPTGNTTAPFLYSFGGDTNSDASSEVAGGVVQTNFRFALGDNQLDDDPQFCWERLNNAPQAIGYRGTSTQLLSSSEAKDDVWVLFGGDAARQATNHVYRYSLVDDAWTQVMFDGDDDRIPAPRWKHAAVALDDHRILISGGRQGSTVHSDVWILDTQTETWEEWTLPNMAPMYRHGMAYDSKRNVVWMYGGLDDNFARYDSSLLWKLDLGTKEVSKVQVPSSETAEAGEEGVPMNTTTAAATNLPPPSLASHAMEYVKEMDGLMMWGGTCSDDSELHIYDIEDNSWCRIFPPNRPDRRDAMLWALDFPRFYIAQGDSICYNNQVLPLADVHVLDFTALDQGWTMLYEPYNERGTGEEPYCDGSNAGNCQPRPLLPFTTAGTDSGTGAVSACSAELMARFWPCCRDRKWADYVGRLRCKPKETEAPLPEGEEGAKDCCQVCGDDTDEPSVSEEAPVTVVPSSAPNTDSTSVVSRTMPTDDTTTATTTWKTEAISANNMYSAATATHSSQHSIVAMSVLLLLLLKQVWRY